MKKNILYRKIKKNGIVSVSPIKTNDYDSTLYRLIADDGKELVCENIRAICIDTNNPEQWIEEDEVEKNDNIN